MAKVKPTVLVKDLGWNRIVRVAKRYAGLGGLGVSVGIQGQAAQEEKAVPSGEAPPAKPVTNVLVASVHEFGAPSVGIPERSFLRSTFDANMAQYEQRLMEISALGLEGQRIEGHLFLLGERARRDVLRKLQSDIPPKTGRQLDPNDPKHMDPALFDTGQLWNSITSVLLDLKSIGGGT